MAFAITQTCCSDATCVSVCPVNCIHPTPEERAFGSTEMLYVDPKSCIDCGACADACPVDAIFPVESLTGPMREYAEINAAYFDTIDPADVDAVATPTRPGFTDSPNFHEWGNPVFDRVLPSDFGKLRVAIVGTGPAAMYAAEDLLLHTPAEVTLVERLTVPGGLVKWGVAPDHPSTKKVSDTFVRLLDHPRTRLHTGVEVGRNLSHDELAAHHDAVIYAVGASTDRRLGIEGEDLVGSIAATRFVAWYNGHPDVAPDAFELSAERVVVVGNGNVAVDVARILVTDPADLEGTSIAPHALEALRASKVREVVLLGRRGPDHAAYTLSELRALRHLDGVELVVDDHDPAVGGAIDAAFRDDKAAVLQGVRRERIEYAAAPPPGRRVVLRFNSPPDVIEGDQEVRSVRVAAPQLLASNCGTADQEIPTGLVIRAIGYRGRPVADLPFDEATGTVPHDAGRVRGREATYVVGWIKRGPSGGIGANRGCAEETVGTLLADAMAGRLPAPTGSTRSFRRLARRASRR